MARDGGVKRCLPYFRPLSRACVRERGEVPGGVETSDWLILAVLNKPKAFRLGSITLFIIRYRYTYPSSTCMTRVDRLLRADETFHHSSCFFFSILFCLPSFSSAGSVALAIITPGLRLKSLFSRRSSRYHHPANFSPLSSVYNT